MNDKEFCDQVHLLIHSVRLIPSYKPSEMDKKVSKLVIEKYSDTCRECKEISEKLKNFKPKKSFFSKLGSALNEN